MLQTEQKKAMSAGSQRVAMVTGAAGGLGAAVARLLVGKGCAVGLVDLVCDKLSNVVQDLKVADGAIESFPADLSDVSECERVVTDAVGRFGKLDILVNCAAIIARSPLDDVTADSFDHVFHVNARAPYFLMRAAMRDMRKRKWGRIVNITSFGVYQGGERITSAPYEATKGALAVFTKAFAKSGAPDGILVNSVCPGPMSTQMLLNSTPKEIVEGICHATPLKRIADPIEVAHTVAWLCSEENTYSTGATFDVGGGWGMH